MENENSQSALDNDNLKGDEQFLLGHVMLNNKQFLLREGLLNLNHGSFGTVPQSVFQCHYHLLLEQESCPEVWFRETYYRYVDQSRALVAELIKAKTEEVVLVENASYAMNSILRSFEFKKGDAVLFFSSAYKMVVDTLSYLSQTTDIELVEVPVLYPVQSAQQLVDAVAETLKSHCNVRLCVFSHISSMPTMIEPVGALTKLCKDHGAAVLIDGAHAPGVLDIDVHDLAADFYLGNCHKWMFSPKGAAFLWVSPQFSLSQSERTPHIQCPQPAVISSSGAYDFVGRFAYTGTRDYTSFAAFPAAWEFIEKECGGMTRMREYCTTLLKKGCDMLVEQWRTYYLVPFEMQAFMANVVLPIHTADEAQRLQRSLMEKHGISVVLGKVLDRESKEIHFMRISAQVYLELSDFYRLNDCVKTLLAEISRDNYDEK